MLKMRALFLRRATVLTAIIVLVVLAASPSGVGRPPDVSARPSADAERLRELAERLLTPPVLGPGAEPVTVRLLPGELPPDAPFAVAAALPPGGRVVGSVVRRTGDAPAGATAILDVPGTAAEILNTADRALTARGWTEAPGGGPPGGLQPALVPIGRLYCESDAGPSLSVTVTPRVTGPSEVRLSLETLFAFQCGGFGGRPPGAELLPPLTAPAAIRLLPSNPLQPLAGGKPALSSSDAIAETDLGVAELEGHFAGQLASAGWTLLERGTAGPVAWSTWTVPGAGEWLGVLFVIEGPGAGRRAIHVQVATAAAPPRPGR
ncbi:MAG: hypothetical protein HYX51_06065 [Chloroflexi bacterium]|nr:hypothetical protein [Chloroflexota bacterium]